MKTSMELVATALQDAINGEPPPSFRSSEFAELLQASRAIAMGGSAGHYPMADYAQIGSLTLSLLVNRQLASMNAEREIAMARDRARPL